MTDIKQMLASNLNDLGEIHLSAKDSAVLLTTVYDLICVERLYERIDNLEQRVIDLQGHDDLGYIDKRLSEYSKVLYQIKPTDRGDHILESVVPTNFGGDAVNYVFRGRLEDCEIVRDQLVGLTSQIQNKTGNTIHEQR